MSRGSDGYLMTWLLEHITRDENGILSLENVKNAIGSKHSSQAIGKAILKLFPGVSVKQQRLKGDWGVRTKIYSGVILKNVEESENEITLNNIKCIATNWFIIKKSQQHVQMGFFNGHSINGNKLITEITFNCNGDLGVSISGKNIDLPSLHISPQFMFTKSSILGVVESVKKIKICTGVSSLTLEFDTENALKELRSYGDDQSCIRYRSKLCQVVIPNVSVYEECSQCRKELQRQKPNVHTCNLDEKNTENENEKLTEQVEDESITLNEKDHKDLQEVLNTVLEDENIPEKLRLFLLTQTENIKKKPKARRWNPEIVRLCLTVYCRSPKTYADICKSGFVVLPSQRLLQNYKNEVHQEAGVNKDILQWMLNEAQCQNLSRDGYEGGIIIDEMSIQEDLQMRKKGDEWELVGFTECTPESLNMDKLLNKPPLQLANHVLQLVFLGHTGFRFPVSHVPTCQASSSELYLLFWKAVKMLSLYGFTVTFVSLDGAQTNRDFMKMLINGKSSTSMNTMMFKNVCDPTKPHIAVIMDYSHAIKKIRNNISKSGFSKNHKKTLKLHSNYILWEHWYKAYQWDMSVNPFKIHQKLTQEHFFLTSQLKMRNKLAEEVLNKDMLHLLECYQKTLGEKGKELDSSIELLRNTSVLVENFRDHRAISEYEDIRLKNNRDVLHWFQNWEKKVKESTKIPEKEKEHHLLSYQTREDITSLILGFDEMCKQRLNTQSSVVPDRINSDVIENIFCQQRGLHNGANSNPNYLTYSRTMNTIILGQTSLSKRSNTGQGAQMYSRQPLCSIQNIMHQ